ncbi:MAG: HAMP domain-containing histidine kinase [Bacteroidales bacterium]|nr:HAMP domain-containing histidine kinase [Bacteroidales bacterium]
MRNKIIIIIIVVSALSLVGLMITQAFWVNKAIELAQQHFEQRAYNALCGTVDRIVKLNNTNPNLITDTTANGTLYKLKYYNFDSTFKKLVEFNKIHEPYEYAIILNSNDSILYKTAGFSPHSDESKKFKKCLYDLNPKVSARIEVIFPTFSRSIICGIWNWLILSVIFLIIIILSFTYIIFSVFRHKKLSEIKSDFINNMTHELKTPISTIAITSEILMKVDPSKNTDKIYKYARIIHEENRRMQLQIEQVLRMAQLDKNEYELNREEVDLHELIQNAIENLFVDFQQKKVSLHYHFEATRSTAMVDPLHFSNIIKNLVDNSYKYSKGDPKIDIYTVNIDGGIQISVVDNGIGIAPENQKYIFDKFYRVPTGNVHDVKGTGIGLYYVKIMTEAHGGHISVKSEQGKGARFDIFIPFQ